MSTCDFECSYVNKLTSSVVQVGGTTVTGTVFTGNTASSKGGAIYSEGASVDLTNCSFTFNSAGFQGGALALVNLVFAVTSSQFSGNTYAFLACRE